MLKGCYCTYSSPMASPMKVAKAEVSLSGLMARSKSSLWNLPISLKAFGKSAISAFSSLNHFFHWSESYSNDWDRFAKTLIVSRALTPCQIGSVIKFLRTSGIVGALGSILPKIKWLTSYSVSFPYLKRILKLSIVDTINLCFSKSPLLQY